MSLKLQQWRSFERCELDFPDGLVGVVGPNGAGKTTLAEAIAWALFGKLRPGARSAAVRRQGADGERALVELVFRLGDVIYRIERVVGGSAKLWIGDSEVPETVAVKATNVRLARDLDMTWEIFHRTVFARQQDVAALDPTRGTDVRRRHVEQLLGLARYRSAATRAGDRVKELEAELRGLREQAPDLTALRAEHAAATDAATGSDPGVGDAEQALVEAKDAVEAAERQLDDARAATSLHAELSARRVRAGDEAERLMALLADRRATAADRAAKIQQLAALDERAADADALAAARRAWDELHDCHAALEAARTLAISFDAQAAGERRTRLATVRAQIDGLLRSPPPSADSLERRIDALELAAQAVPVEVARERLRTVEAAIADRRARAAVLDDEVSRGRAHLEAIERSGPDTSCTVCLRPYGADFTPILDAHRQRLAAAQSLLADRRGELAELERERDVAAIARAGAERAAQALERTSGPDDLATARAAHSATLAAIETHRARLTRLETEQRELQPAVTQDAADEHEATVQRGRIAECTSRWDAALAFADVPAYDASAHAAAVARHEAAAADRDRRHRLQSEIDATASVSDEIAASEGALRASVSERDEASSALEAMRFDATAEVHLRRLRDMANDERVAAGVRLGEARAAAQARDARVADLAERIVEAQRHHEAIDARERTYREHGAAAGILTEFRTQLSARAWPQLEQRAGALLSEATGGRYADVRLSTDYKLVIADRGETHGVERYSGGEQDLANLCLRLAIADWVARERGVGIGFVVLDEVFGSQDEERRQRLLGELRALGNRFQQVLVITHMPDIAELCDHQIVVGLDRPGQSTAALVSV